MPWGLRLDDVEFTTETLDEHPEHAAVVGRIVTSFSLIEGIVGAVYGFVKHEAIEDALKELKRMRGNRERVAAIQKTLEQNPSSAHAMKTTLMLERVLKYAEQRNKVAHGLWGRKTSKPDVLYHLPLKKVILFAAPLIANGTAGKPVKGVKMLAAAISHYTLADLQAVEEEGKETLAEVFDCFNMIGKAAAIADGWEQATDSETGEDILRTPPAE